LEPEQAVNDLIYDDDDDDDDDDDGGGGGTQTFRAPF
jgi:hypothetical protein